MTVEFAFGGRISLDFTWTLRYRAISATELLVGPDALADWLYRAVLREKPTCDDQLLEQAKELREAIHRAASAAAFGDVAMRHDVHVLNTWSAEPATYPQLAEPGTLVMTAGLHDAGRAGLATIAQDAVRLIGAGTDRVRMCQGPWCSLLFYDESRPGSRKWCSTDRCGNRVNTKAYRNRHRDD